MRLLTAIGTAAALSCCGTALASPSNLLKNGDFETGDFTGWKLHGNLSFTEITTAAYSGLHAAEFGAFGSATRITQRIVDLPGQLLTIGGWLANDIKGNNKFQIVFDGKPVLTLRDLKPQAYTLESAAVVGTGKDVVTFAFRNDSGWFRFDDAYARIAEPSGIASWAAGLALIGLATMTRSRRARSAGRG